MVMHGRMRERSLLSDGDVGRRSRRRRIWTMVHSRSVAIVLEGFCIRIVTNLQLSHLFILICGHCNELCFGQRTSDDGNLTDFRLNSKNVNLGFVSMKRV
jgi:hypothetical protein